MPPAPADVPVVVSRWFEAGHGYAYTPGLSTPDLVVVVALVRKYICPTMAGDHVVDVPGGRSLLLVSTLDDKPLDDRADDRQPTIVRVAIVPAGTKQWEKNALTERLRYMDVPDKPGETAVAMKWPRLQPLPRKAGGRASLMLERWSIPAVLTTCVAADVGVYLQNHPADVRGIHDLFCTGSVVSRSSGADFGLLARTVASAVMVVVWLVFRKPVPNLRAVVDCEYRLLTEYFLSIKAYEAAKPVCCRFIFWELVRYTQVEFYGGEFALAGEETGRASDGGRVRFRFTRLYEYNSGWKISRSEREELPPPS